VAHFEILVGFRYDFDLRTGKSETGLRACTYAVDIRTDPTDGADVVWVETPEGGSSWRLVELQPVSEGTIPLNRNTYVTYKYAAFADPPPPIATAITVSNTTNTHSIDEEVVPASNAPTTLMEWAVLILNTANPALKV
jgi:hypothetical protein